MLFRSTGVAYVVAEDNSPFGAGWTLAGVDKLVSVTATLTYAAGMLREYGSGGYGFYADNGAGGMFGSGVMGAGTRMMATGLSMGQVQAVTRETIAFAREKVGEDAVGEIVGAIPGLGQFI